ncbi:MAG: antirestriction protein ArdA [Gordonia sp. (in: high G+C Gram-positive bacteria)]|uniref:antirestriction protein ArdA n=1 Tax=Gordonia sp. (in: high G+C Gram-positive bacteria) TaxID=84139 RepID=UPI0039E3771E
MTMFADVVPTPRVWVGCLHCYNSGRLVGEWFDALGAENVTTQQVHGGRRVDPVEHEEIWVMDTDEMPVSEEMSTVDAGKWGEAIDSVPAHLRRAYYAWIASGSIVEDGDGMPSVSDFEERYAGEWDSLSEYLQDLAIESGLLNGVDEEIANYIDWRAYARDRDSEYTVVDAPGLKVHVFRDF